MAQPLAMSRITNTLLRRWRIGSKDCITEVSTGAVAGQGVAEGPRGENGSGYRAANAPQGRSA